MAAWVTGDGNADKGAFGFVLVLGLAAAASAEDAKIRGLGLTDHAVTEAELEKGEALPPPRFNSPGVAYAWDQTREGDTVEITLDKDGESLMRNVETLTRTVKASCWPARPAYPPAAGPRAATPPRSSQPAMARSASSNATRRSSNGVPIGRRAARSGSGRVRSCSGGPRLILNKRVAVVLPAYNAAIDPSPDRDLVEIPRDVVDDIILTDDASVDETVRDCARARARTSIRARQ